MVDVRVQRVPGLADWWPSPQIAADYFPDWMKELKKKKKTTAKLNMSDCLPAIESMLQGIVIGFPCDMTFEYIETSSRYGKIIKCDHVGYPIIGGHESSQYAHSEFKNYHIIKIGLPWIFVVPHGYSCLFTQPFNRNGGQDSFCISGAVQSDTYYNMVNIPFAINLKKEKDTISLRKGDPFVQVVPFLREKVKIIQEKADLNELGTVIEKIEKNTNFYKDQIKIKY